MDSAAVDREIDRMAEEVVRRRSGNSEPLDSVVWDVVTESEWFDYTDATEAETPFKELLDAIDTEPEQRVVRWAEGQPKSTASFQNWHSQRSFEQFELGQYACDRSLLQEQGNRLNETMPHQYSSLLTTLSVSVTLLVAELGTVSTVVLNRGRESGMVGMR